MYQRILVPIDGSTTSDCAMEEAVKLAAHFGGQIELVHVLADILDWVEENYMDYAELQASYKERGEKILAKAQKIAQQANVTAETKLIEAAGGRIASVIVAEAERWQAELIVIGTHGHSGVSRLLLGSVADSVVRAASVPVLLIRGH